MLLSTAQVAEKYRVSQMTVRRWIYSKRLKASQLGGHSWMVKEKDLAEFKRPKRGRPKKEVIDK